MTPDPNRLSKAQKTLLLKLDDDQGYVQLFGREIRTARALLENFALVHFVKYARLHPYSGDIEYVWYEASITARGHEIAQAIRTANGEKK
jgi:hypothetical protein